MAEYDDRKADTQYLPEGRGLECEKTENWPKGMRPRR